MHELSALIKKDMVSALGVTEPGAISFCVAKAKSYAKGELLHLNVAMNSGMYKNAFTCGIPNSKEVGNVFAAALGYVAGNPDKGLESLANVTPADNICAQRLIDEGKITVALSGISSRIFMEATLETTESKVLLTIRDTHTNITKIVVNGETVLEAEEKDEAIDRPEAGITESDKTEEGCGITESNKVAEGTGTTKIHSIHRYTLAELVDYVNTVSLEEIEFVKEAYKVNLELFEEALKNPRTTFARQLLAMNGGEVISKDEQMTASLLCNATIEARVIGLDKPAMSITGSGAHGIIATMPLYGVYKIHGLSEEMLYRATMLSYLICTYIKEYSGRLSAFCGCAIAAGTGMACGLVYLKGGTVEQMEYTLNNMASSITGMICDGGNQGCTMKGVAACDAAFRSVAFAMKGVHIDKVHGINGNTPEETMRNMGLIASPGMVGTEKTIVEIFEEKLR
ncbi:serine dehydratase subunit alpha family protein [Oribacterium parvum]|uniref:L-cysteine desulfidase family protein n=1 Tax=Oribacterium parvum TaxID=1501329 RepID=UPI0028DBE8B0|nr:L-serine ammonia-lyase, iron-sulfur-dependent, subunit alpha [Oribacterium parvum]